MGFSSFASAQFSDNDVKLYVSVGSSLENPRTEIWGAMTINGYTVFSFCTVETMRFAKSRGDLDAVLIDPNEALKYINDYIGINANRPSKFNTLISQYYVFNLADQINFAVSEDLKTMIRWTTGYEDRRKYYRLVDPSEFNPKSVNYDFLYE